MQKWQCPLDIEIFSFGGGQNLYFLLCNHAYMMTKPSLMQEFLWHWGWKFWTCNPLMYGLLGMLKKLSVKATTFINTLAHFNRTMQHNPACKAAHFPINPLLWRFFTDYIDSCATCKYLSMSHFTPDIQNHQGYIIHEYTKPFFGRYLL